MVFFFPIDVLLVTMVIPLRQEEIVDLVTAMAMETTVIPEQEVRL